MSLVQEYFESLAALSGNDFQAEVCARLQSVILSFQTVPAKPHGDAGLDAFSHEGNMRTAATALSIMLSRMIGSAWSRS